MEERFNIPTKKKKKKKHVICNLQDCKTNVAFERKKVATFLGCAQQHSLAFQYLTQ